jgi:NAD(P)-dependent dehydrogenase (short-subunit alcohol dehydrogenase family)
MKTKWTIANIPSLAGRRVVITGANSGIGFETALELARKGAEVVLPARTQAKAEEAVARILKQVPGARLHAEIVDLASQKSVRAFAKRVIEKFPGESLDLLINNAGVMALPTRELTEDGFERQFATNYLGPFALTGLLLASLKARAGSRVVTVSSGISNQGKIEFDNLQGERKYKPMLQSYAQSKLADLIFSQELQRRLQAAGSPILSTAAHPGYAVTNLQAPHLSFGWKLTMGLLKPLMSQDAAHGALPTLYAAVANDVVGGGYYGPDGPGELKGFPQRVSLPKTALDLEVARRLWAESERLTGVQYGGVSANGIAHPDVPGERADGFVVQRMAGGLQP